MTDLDHPTSPAETTAEIEDLGQPLKPSKAWTEAVHGLTEVIATALAARFTPAHGSRNPNWDPEAPDGPDNEYLQPLTMDHRRTLGAYRFFDDGEGGRSFAAASCNEIAALIAETLSTRSTTTIAPAPGGEQPVMVTTQRTRDTRWGLLNEHPDGTVGIAYSGTEDRTRQVLADQLFPRDEPPPNLGTKTTTTVAVNISTGWHPQN